MPNQFRRHNSRAAVLTATLVREIRELYAAGKTQGALAREFGVSAGQIGRIVRGESWAYLPMTSPTAAERDAEIQRILNVQKEVNMDRQKRGLPPIPLSPLEGGDPAADAESGTDRLQQEASRTGDAMVKELKDE